MAAPAKSFTVIPDTKIDADSPFTEELATFLRDNIEHLEEWLGKDFVAAINHNHDGVNSALTSIGSSIKPLQPEVLKATGSFVPYIDIDISADTGTDTAQWALVGIKILTSAANHTIQLRKKGSSTNDMVFVFDSLGGDTSFQCWVPVDANEVFQIRVAVSGATVEVKLQGYAL